MTEQENELLEMYIEYIRKRNLIIFIIVFIVVALGIFGLYKFKTLNNNVEEANVIEEVIKEENIIKEEVKVENNVEIKEQKVEENTQTQNVENTTISNEKIETEKKEENKKEKTEKVENKKVLQQYQRNMKIRIFFLKMDIQWKMLHRLHRTI